MSAHRRPISRAKRFRVLARDKFRCVYCGATPSEAELHIDHLFPVCEGGDDSESNLVTACADCNIGKRGQVIPDLSKADLANQCHRALHDIRRIVQGFRAEASREILLSLQAFCERPAIDWADKCCEEQRRVYQEVQP